MQLTLTLLLLAMTLSVCMAWHRRRFGHGHGRNRTEGGGRPGGYKWKLKDCAGDYNGTCHTFNMPERPEPGQPPPTRQPFVCPEGTGQPKFPCERPNMEDRTISMCCTTASYTSRWHGRHKGNRTGGWGRGRWKQKDCAGDYGGTCHTTQMPERQPGNPRPPRPSCPGDTGTYRFKCAYNWVNRTISMCCAKDEAVEAACVREGGECTDHTFEVDGANRWAKYRALGEAMGDACGETVRPISPPFFCTKPDFESGEFSMCCPRD